MTKEIDNTLKDFLQELVDLPAEETPDYIKRVINKEGVFLSLNRRNKNSFGLRVQYGLGDTKGPTIIISETKDKQLYKQCLRTEKKNGKL